MFKNPKFLISIALVCLVLLSIIGFLSIRNRQTTVSFTPSEVESNSSWKTYENARYGGVKFKIDIPNNWFIKENYELGGIKLSNKDTPFVDMRQIPQKGEVMILFEGSHSAYENGSGPTEVEEEGIGTVVYDTRWMTPDECDCFGMKVIYIKEDPNIIELKQELDKIVATFEFSSTSN